MIALHEPRPQHHPNIHYDIYVQSWYTEFAPYDNYLQDLPGSSYVFFIPLLTS